MCSAARSRGAPIRDQRPLGVVERPQARIAERRQEIGLLVGIVGDLGFAREDLGQLFPGLELAQHAIQRRQHVLLVTGQAQRLAQEVGRLREVVQLILVQLGEAHRERALQTRVEGRVHALFVDRRQPAVVAARAREPLQRLARLGLGRFLGQCARPGRERLGGIAPLGLLDARDLREHRQSRCHRVLDLEPQLEELDDRVPFAPGAQDRIERRHRLQAVVAAHAIAHSASRASAWPGVRARIAW